MHRRTINLIFCVLISYFSIINLSWGQVLSEKQEIGGAKKQVSFRLFGPEKKPVSGKILVFDENGLEKEIEVYQGRVQYALPPNKYIFKAQSEKFKNVTLEFDLKTDFTPVINFHFKTFK